jgi:1,2-diacylglycerol 3-alpha-glucosyltransferase
MIDHRKTRIAIMFSIFGPYMVARTNALVDRFDVVGIEGAQSNDIYAWVKHVGHDQFRRTTLFTDEPISRKSAAVVYARLSAVLNECKPDVVIVPDWSSSWGYGMLTWAVANAVPAVIMSESTPHDFIRIWWREEVKRRVLGAYSAALVGGRLHIDNLVRLGMPSDRVFTGYDVIDNAYFEAGADKVRAAPDAARRHFDLPEHYFLASARFVARKNLERVVDAFAHYRKNAGDSAWELVILGDGEEKASLQRRIAQHGLSAAVRLPGFKQYDELPAYYGLAGAFIHASITEQWGLVVNEAAAAGLPLIVSNRCGCAPELVEEGGNGHTFEPEDTAGLAQAMLQITSPTNDLARMGRRSREIIADFGPQAFASGLEKAIAVALAQPRAQPGVLDRSLIRALRNM